MLFVANNLEHEIQPEKTAEDRIIAGRRQELNKGNHEDSENEIDDKISEDEDQDQASDNRISVDEIADNEKSDEDMDEEEDYSEDEDIPKWPKQGGFNSKQS